MGEKEDAVFYALFQGNGNCMYLLEINEWESERSIPAITREIDWDELGVFLKIFSSKYQENGNGARSRAEQDVCDEALSEFKKRIGTSGSIRFLPLPIKGRRMIRLSAGR